MSILVLVVAGNGENGNTYRPIKVCMECVTSLVTKVTSDDVTMMTSGGITLECILMLILRDVGKFLTHILITQFNILTLIYYKNTSFTIES